ncbi:MAG: hypothetical protein K2M84_06270 [Anaeroplasmataceae bacterium]|nr:hypothetical protein [Anaeroplasmataceae bacterium]MDE7385345.1 hypothetical protein [Anaeroplasmataceae bacterium]
MTGTKVFKKILLISILLFSLVSCQKNIPQEQPPSHDENPIETPTQPEESNTPEVITKMILTINENKLEITLAKNSAVDALIEILKQKEITIIVNDYGGFEKVGDLGFSLPTSNSQITTEPGDVILYSGNQIVLFYGNNTWSYTRLGKIEGYSVNELRNILNADKGSIKITLSLD